VKILLCLDLYDKHQNVPARRFLLTLLVQRAKKRFPT
jgi:hypothetical protein